MSLLPAGVYQSLGSILYGERQDVLIRVSEAGSDLQAQSTSQWPHWDLFETGKHL